MRARQTAKEMNMKRISSNENQFVQNNNEIKWIMCSGNIFGLNDDRITIYKLLVVLSSCIANIIHLWIDKKKNMNIEHRSYKWNFIAVVDTVHKNHVQWINNAKWFFSPALFPPFQRLHQMLFIAMRNKFPFVYIDRYVFDFCFEVRIHSSLLNYCSWNIKHLKIIILMIFDSFGIWNDSKWFIIFIWCILSLY